jgi:hypothetical protein
VVKLPPIPRSEQPVRRRVILLGVGEGAGRDRAVRYLATLASDPRSLDAALASPPAPVTEPLPAAKAAAVADYLADLGCRVRLEDVAEVPPAFVPIEASASRPPVRLFPLALLVAILGALIGVARWFPVPEAPAPTTRHRVASRTHKMLIAEDLPLTPPPVAAPAFARDPGESLDPRAIALNQEGVKLFEQGDLEGALARFEDAHDRAPSSANITKNLSDLYTFLGWSSVKARDYDRALVQFDRALGLRNDNLEAWKGSGYVHLQLKETDAAIRALEEAARIAPDDADTALALAKLLYQSDDLDRAKLVLDAAKLLSRMRNDASVEQHFQSNDTGHFRLKFDGGANAAVSSVVSAILEEAYSKIGADFHYYPPDPVVVILYTQNEFRSVSGSPDWSRGVYDGKIRIPVGGVNERSGELEDVIYHEYTHVVVQQIARGRCPTWMNEGLAQYEEPSVDGGKRALLAALKRHGVIPLADLEGSFMKLPENQAEIAYAQGYAAVLYIADSYSFYHLRSILDEIGDGRTAEQAVKDVLHFGYDDLQAGIADYLRRSG